MTSISSMSQDDYGLKGLSDSSSHLGQSISSSDGVCYCQALYNYTTLDPSSLSFEQGDVLEVHTQLDSGWWDGYLGPNGPRGWFPSNYVKLITLEEAENALLASQTPLQAEFSSLNPFHTRSRSNSSVRRPRTGRSSTSHSRSGSDSSLDGRFSHEFWQPELTPDGKLYFINTVTGQQSADIPLSATLPPGDRSIAGFASSPYSSRSGSSSNLGLTYPQTRHDRRNASIDRLELTHEHMEAINIARRPQAHSQGSYTPSSLSQSTSTSRLENSVDHSRPPTPLDDSITPSALTSLQKKSPPQKAVRVRPIRLRSDSSISSSDVSDMVSPRSRAETAPGNRTQSVRALPPITPNLSTPTTSSMCTQFDDDYVTVTAAERSAYALQRRLTPPLSEPVQELANIAREAVFSVVDMTKSHDYKALQENESTMDFLIRAVATSIRDLLHISEPAWLNHDHYNANRNSRHRQEQFNTQEGLKTVRRRITATLAKLVLSARSIQYDTDPRSSNAPVKIRTDAADLEITITIFLNELDGWSDTRIPGGTGYKRRHGVFSNANLGPDLVGAGAAGNWKGMGWIAAATPEVQPEKHMVTEVVAEMDNLIQIVLEQATTCASLIRRPDYGKSAAAVASCQYLAALLSSLIEFFGTINIANHIDIDGDLQDNANGTIGKQYSDSVRKARVHVRTLEAAMQALYDDGAFILIESQSMHLTKSARAGEKTFYGTCDNVIAIIQSNLGVVRQTINGLLVVGRQQADMARDDHRKSIERRSARLSSSEPQRYRKIPQIISFAHQNGLSSTADPFTDIDPILPSVMYSERSPERVTRRLPEHDTRSILEDEEEDEDSHSVFGRSPPRVNKVEKFFGNEVPSFFKERSAAAGKPWYLRPNYDADSIQIDEDGTVKAGTVKGLVDRLTAHEQPDTNFTKTVLMTYKSFTTIDELFELLKERFWLEAPDVLSSLELEDWNKNKLEIVRLRVINTLKLIVQDEDADKDDMHILNDMKKFVMEPEVSKTAGVKALLTLIDRAQSGGDVRVKQTVLTAVHNPPAAIIPKVSKKLKLVDIDPLELARQLTIMESRLFHTIKTSECLARARESKSDETDNITVVTQNFNRLAFWIQDSILEKGDPRKRSLIIKHFISVAEQCRRLLNFSSLFAIVSGLNAVPIRRLKKSWEFLNSKTIDIFATCESVIDPNRNFNNYRVALAAASSACVPYIGTFLTTLTFIQQGSKDTLPENLINFRKRTKVSDVIRDIKRLQSQSHNFQPVPIILVYIEESLFKFRETNVDHGETLWKFSLEREPREEDKIAQALHDNGLGHKS